MTAIAAAKTWPTVDRLEEVLEVVRAACNALDVLALETRALLTHEGDGFHDPDVSPDVSPPTFADVGALTRFVELARMDVAQIAAWVAEFAQLRDNAACLLVDDAS